MVPIDLNTTAGSEEEKALGREILKFYTNTDTLSWDINVIKGYIDVSLSHLLIKCFLTVVIKSLLMFIVTLL